MIQHMHRKKKCDLEHAVWHAANHRRYFPIGCAKPVQHKLNIVDVETVISRHCGAQFLKHLKEDSPAGQEA